MNRQPIAECSGRALPLRRRDVDTDQIIPAEFCKRLGRTGYEDTLFHRWRQEQDFVLNRPEYDGASVLVAGPDFGIGSSREHAVWALRDYGFNVLIAPGFGDIFRVNSTKNQVLTAQVSEDSVEEFWEIIEAAPETIISVDLADRRIRIGSTETDFGIDDYSRWQLMNGLDDIDVTLDRAATIDVYEQKRPPWLPSVPVSA